MPRPHSAHTRQTRKQEGLESSFNKLLGWRGGLLANRPGAFAHKTNAMNRRYGQSLVPGKVTAVMRGYLDNTLPGSFRERREESR